MTKEVEVVITAYKVFEDWIGEEELFEFLLQPVDPESLEKIESERGSIVAANEKGVITFEPLSFNEPGIYDYVIKEIKSEKKDWRTDESIYHLTIDVSFSVKGQWEINITSHDGLPLFVNQYENLDEKVDVNLFAQVETIGDLPLSGSFNFVIKDEEGKTKASTNEIEPIISSTTGMIHFPPLSFTQSGVYFLTVHQTATSEIDWKTDTRTYPIVVVIYREKGGAVQAQTDYVKGIPSFINISAKEEWPIPRTQKSYSSLSRKNGSCERITT